jgi:hypothetical protein
MSKGMQCMANGPSYPTSGKGDVAELERPGQSKESFGGGPLVSDIR